MSIEQLPPEQEDDEFIVVGLETFPRLAFTPVEGLKRWLETRRQRKEDLSIGPERLRRELGAYAVMHPHFNADQGIDHFYGGPDLLGVFAEVPHASADNFSRQSLEQAPDLIDD